MMFESPMPADSEADATLAEGGSLSGDTLAATEVPGSPTAMLPIGIERGALIGRYVVLSKLGAGGMGVVLAAYDPELDRKVAIKLLKPHGGDQAAARTRLQREAQALAKLDHPNVVGVHDVGVHAEQLFVAMEFVAGQTLGAWMRAESRAWPAVVSKFVEAGRGLAAAHEAGLIHRDFKPDNVMLGDDGRVRVMDFGLARADGDVEALVEIEGLGKQRLRDAVTEVGALVGTLAYMAPEQFLGQPADARSDQFSFCVSLFEALYAQRPFAAESLVGLLDAMEREQVRIPPRSANVPMWLRKVVLRGLARDPAQRWPSVSALLDALLDDPSVRRRKAWLAVGLVSLLGVSIWGVTAIEREAPICPGMDEKLVGVWDDARRAEVEAAILATELGYAPATWERIEQHLDDYANAWVAAREQACMASHRGEQSGILLDLRMACLDEQLEHLRATVHELANADAEVVNKSVQAVMGLPSLDRCADVDALAAQVPPPEDEAVAARVRALDAKLIEATAKHQAGRYEESVALMGPVVAEAEQLGYEPLIARASLLYGKLLRRTSDYQGAIAAFERAYEVATVQRMTAEAASSASWLMYVLGYDVARPEDGQRWAAHADPLSRAARSDTLRADYLDTAGTLAEERGEYELARDYQEQALALRVRELGPKHPSVAMALNNLAIIAEDQGNYAEARKLYEQAMNIRIEALGPDHPVVAGTLINLGNLDFRAGKFAEARQAYERALALSERALGPEHPDVANALNGLGSVAFAENDYAASREYRIRVLDILQKTRGPDHPSVANTLGNLGNIAFDEGKLAEARDYYERALAIREKLQGPDHPEVAALLVGVAKVAYEDGDYAASRSYDERALAIWERTVGRDHPHASFSLMGLARVAIAEGSPAGAVAHLERALAIRSANELDPNMIAETQFLLARALWDAKGDRKRARELAESARTTWAKDAAWSSNVELVDEWLAKRR
jgi:tetratricopeptide (TPR) repeat protein/tRNA A-37 threonylcarbamoyl transferase component Bud32